MKIWSRVFGLNFEALKTRSYLNNRYPSSALGDKTSEGARSEEKSNFGHSRVFGCDALCRCLRRIDGSLTKNQSSAHFWVIIKEWRDIGCGFRWNTRTQTAKVWSFNRKHNPTIKIKNLIIDLADTQQQRVPMAPKMPNGLIGSQRNIKHSKKYRT